jgi:predicted molibdopterin-dependent oxidoreductase YjgC
MRIERLHPKRPLIERGEVITIWIDGRETTAYAGETVAAVLAAQGRWDYRYTERPFPQPIPGFFCGMGICYGCVLLVDGRLQRACLAEVRAGMQILTRQETAE